MPTLAADNKYTQPQIFLRGFVYLAISITMGTYALMMAGVTNPWLAGVMLMKEGLIVFRAYLDKTPSHGEGQSEDGNNGITTESK